MSSTRQSSITSGIDPNLELEQALIDKLAADAQQAQADILAASTAVQQPVTPPRPRPTWNTVEGTPSRPKQTLDPRSDDVGEAELLNLDGERKLNFKLLNIC